MCRILLGSVRATKIEKNGAWGRIDFPAHLHAAQAQLHDARGDVLPSYQNQRVHKIAHHTLGDGVFGNFVELSAGAACCHAVINPENCVVEIERIIAEARRNNQPAYIAVLTLQSNHLSGERFYLFCAEWSELALVKEPLPALLTLPLRQ